MPKVTITREIDCLSEEDLDPVLYEDDDPENNKATIDFVDDYRRCRDEEGYSPPKYFIMDGGMDEIVGDVLKKWDIEEEFDFDHERSRDSMEMSKVYAVGHDGKPFKMTQYSNVCLRRTSLGKQRAKARLSGEKSERDDDPAADVPIKRRKTQE